MTEAPTGGSHAEPASEHPTDPSGNPSGNPSGDPTGDPSGATPGTAATEPRWWHRDHPTFTALSGFFAGLAFVILVPGLFAAVLGSFLDFETTEGLFPFVVVTLALPIGLAAAPRTRRFGLYMLLGMVLTALVVGVVAALVLWVLVSVGS